MPASVSCRCPPADLLGAAGIDPAAERRGHQLATEADAQQWPVLLQSTFDQAKFGDQKRIGIGVADADRAAKHDQEIGLLDIGTQVSVGEVGARHIDQRNVPALAVQQRGQQAEVFERDMAQGDGVAPGRGHGSSPG